jgi:8-oxo-dGTP diphosphatase
MPITVVEDRVKKIMNDVITQDDTAPRVDVAVAVIVNSKGEFMLALRPQGKPYAGYWEFPGGKLEHGEQPQHALQRELEEELGIRVNVAYPWVTHVFDYPHAKVKLHFFRVLNWSGELRPKEGQQIAWQSLQKRIVEPLLPANGPILRALRLPSTYAISNAENSGVKLFMKQLELALRRGLRFVQIREKAMPRKSLLSLTKDAVELAHEFGARVLVNSDIGVAEEAKADGVHLTSVQLGDISIRPTLACCGASCHDAADLDRAVRLGVDFVVLGPVQFTPSHASVTPLGWELFSLLIRDYPLPVYALGGLQQHDMTTSWKHGAHGIAMLSAIWPEILGKDKKTTLADNTSV